MKLCETRNHVLGILTWGDGTRISETLLGTGLSPAMNLEQTCKAGRRVSTMEVANQDVDEEASAWRTQLRKDQEEDVTEPRKLWALEGYHWEAKTTMHRAGERGQTLIKAKRSPPPPLLEEWLELSIGETQEPNRFWPKQKCIHTTKALPGTLWRLSNYFLTGEKRGQMQTGTVMFVQPWLYPRSHAR